MRIRSKLLVILACLAMALAFPVATSAYFQKAESNCGPYNTGANFACFKEDINGGGDVLLVLQNRSSQVTYVSQLNQIAVINNLRCNNGTIFNDGSWNDCISWMYYNIQAGWEVCGFRDSGFQGGVLWDKVGPGTASVNFSGSSNDAATSIRIEPVTGGYC